MSIEKTVYQTNDLGILVGPVLADPDPLEPGKWLVPGGCVETPPPEAPEFKTPCWINDQWHLVEYYNGLTVYNTATTQAKVIDSVGPIPNGYTLKKPGPNQVWKNGQWINDIETELRKLYEEKTNEMFFAWIRYGVDGFVSSSLGEPHRYGTNSPDEIDILFMAANRLEVVFECIDDMGNKVFELHTADQLQTVSKDLALQKKLSREHYNTLVQALDKALADKDLDAMRAIEWTLTP